MSVTLDNLYQLLLGYVKKRVSNPMDAEDITQEVFYKLSKSDSSKIKNVKSWIFTIAQNTLIDHYRKKKRELESLKESFLAESETDTEVLQDLERCVVPFIELLPAPYDEILRKSEIEQIPQKQIAEEFQMNYVTLRSKVQRGRTKLKELFADCCKLEIAKSGSVLGYQKNHNCC